MDGQGALRLFAGKVGATVEELAGSHLMEGVSPEEAAKNFVKSGG